MALNIFEATGKKFLQLFLRLGNISIFIFQSLSKIFVPPFYFKNIKENLINVAFFSLPLIGLTAFFSGAVLALQSYYGFGRLNAESYLPSIVALSITRELAPVFSALMISGRVGAAIAARIGSMKVTEQINALQTLSIDPYRYLVAPRVISLVIAMPFIVIIFDLIGIFGGYIVATNMFNFSATIYLHKTLSILQFLDIQLGLIKGVFFGLAIALVSCYNGYNCDNNSDGVGKATTNSVVISSVIVLLLNYLITDIFLL